MNRTPLRLALLLFTFHFSPFTAIADTTRVSGAVSGVWNADGNPTGSGDVYIIEDSTWVAEDDSLVLRGGTEIYFEENQGLYIFGNLSTTGTGHEGWNEYSVRIRVLEGVEHWRGIRLYGERETRLDYLRVVVPDTLFILDDGYSFTMTRSIIEAAGTAFCGYVDNGNAPYTGHFWNLNFESCIIEGGMQLHLWGSSVTADYCSFDFRYGDRTDDGMLGFGLAGPGTRAVFTNTSVYGGLRAAGWSIIEDCRFLAVPDGFGEIYVVIDGICRRTFIDGGAGIGTTEPIVDVTVSDVFGPTALDSFGVELVRCVIGEYLSIAGFPTADGFAAATMRNCIISRGLGMTGVGPIVFDSCYVGISDSDDGPLANQINIGPGCNVLFKHCLIQSEIGVASAPNDNTPRIFDHNTFVLDIGNDPLYSCLLNNGATFTNNIMINLRRVQVPVIGYMVGLTESMFQYNCVWGFDGYMESYDPDTTIDFPPTNLIVNPEVTLDGISWLLNHNSPCIDAGNPDSTMDPDGTRNDIGYRFFYQRNRAIERIEELLSPSMASLGAFPNPFNSSTTIRFSTGSQAGPVRLSIFDLSGREIARLLDTKSEIGNQKSEIVWDASNQPSGIYLIRLEAAGGVRTGKVMLIR